MRSFRRCILINNDLEQIKRNCLEKWCGDFDADKKLIEVQERFNDWFTQIPDQYRSTVKIPFAV
jgi:hypothetical protein